jgi:hypothetical protein
MPSKGSIPRTCEQCGTAFTAYPSQIKLGEGRFCSLSCASTYTALRRPRRDPAERFWSRVDRSGGPDACWPWTGPLNRGGYGVFYWHEKDVPAHRVAYEITHGPVPHDVFVCHNCPGGDWPACCNPAHLWSGSHAENMADKVAKGRQPRGEAHGSAKLTETQVSEIRHLANVGALTRRAIARRYAVHPNTVWQILARKRWKHVH